MAAAQAPEGFWLLADPSQEVLIDSRPAFSQLAPVPLRQLGSDPMTSCEPHLAAGLDATPDRWPADQGRAG